VSAHARLQPLELRHGEYHLFRPVERGRGRVDQSEADRCGSEIRRGATVKPAHLYDHWGTTADCYRPTSVSPVYCTHQREEKTIITIVIIIIITPRY